MPGPVAKAHTLVVKVGSSLVTNEGRGLDVEAIARWAAQIAKLHAAGKRCVLVSSGAIAEGMQRLGWTRRPHAMHELQAAAAVGQMGLVQCYESCFREHGLATAQVLLTHADMADRQRYLNARSTLRTLLALGVIPVINENDTVAVDEIKFGDNDHLSSLVTNLIQAHLLVILTDTEGLHDADPRRSRRTRLIPLVREITPAIERLARNEPGGVGTGGMASKVAAARKTIHFGVPCVLASGRRQRIVSRILQGEPVGTFFLPRPARLSSRKHWIAFTREPQGTLRVDEGAVAALRDRGKSLLPSGVVEVAGRFRAGDLVRIVDPRGLEFARGLAGYSAEETSRIKGLRTSEIEKALGYRATDELIHRDDLVLL